MRRYHKWDFAPDALDPLEGRYSSAERCRRCGALRFWNNTRIVGYRTAHGAQITEPTPPCPDGNLEAVSEQPG